ncbi:hypothetical protein BU23DRAFT_254442 [Bimuria novae-zelandiae CBS 107.79]|uniref:Uncharacterized protein n=1 Tax=Bimuria novae-zelandiae CBS 107.79 TaxID=1447943 RepID=A0A6A5VP32_9PLEO|nr:hypothetical protein BU23DRAFT_254442 [Bimuria novae-zelandiae CBS 107.79]
MIATRKTFVEANNQHLPEEAWLVIGEPSKGILMLNFWISAMVAEQEERMAFAGLELKAAIARRFCIRHKHQHTRTKNQSTFGSSSSSFSHSCTVAAETSCRNFVDAYLGAMTPFRRVFSCSDVVTLRAFSPTTTYPSFIWRACRRSMSFSLIAASDGLDWLAPMLF